MIRTYKDFTPKILNNVFLAETSMIIGKVKINSYSSIWPNAILRGDEGNIIIGSYTNIQDNSTIHTDENGVVEIGDYVTIGHNSVIHGCKIKNNVIVGMGSIIMNGSKIGNNCIIGAGALITQNTIIPDNSLVMGFPAKIKGELNSEQIKNIKDNALIYWNLAKEYLR